MKHIPSILLLTALAGLAQLARADDAPFLNADPASVLGKGEMAVQSLNGVTHVDVGMTATNFFSQAEFDYGITDKLQLATSVIYHWARVRELGEPAESADFVGVEGELVWKLLDANDDLVGLALAGTTTIAPDYRGAVLRALFTKYVSGFENVLNIGFADRWLKLPLAGWIPFSDITINYGIAHPLNEHWQIGAEFNSEFVFDGLWTSGNTHNGFGTFYVGPVAQYECKSVTVSVIALTEIPASFGSDVQHGLTPNADRWRIAIRLVHNL